MKMKRLKFSKFGSLALTAVGFLAVVFALLKPATDPDWGWHRRLGEFILNNRQVPWQDMFSHTMGGYRVADFYWLSEVIMVGLEKTVGIFGLSLICALVAALAVGLATGFQPFVSFLVALLLIPAAGVRPFNFGLLFFSILWRLLRRQKFRWLPPLFLIWANFYANFVFGLLLVFLFLGTETVRRRKISWPLVAVSLLSAAATLVTPYGVFLWQTLAAEAGSQLMRNTIAEWLPPNPHTDFGLLFFAFLFFIAFLMIRRSKKLDLAETGLIAVFACLGIFSIYYIPLFAVIIGPFLVREISNISLRSFIKLYATVCLTIFALLVGPLRRLPQAGLQGQALAESGDYPYEAVEFLRENSQDGRLFNDYVWGGYLIWQLPEVKTFIDGRMPAWKAGENYVFADYLKVVQLKPGWEDVLQKYDISYFLIRSNSTLAQALKVHPEWGVVHEDDLAIVFRK
jgi:hypothetical protein